MNKLYFVFFSSLLFCGLQSCSEVIDGKEQSMTNKDYREYFYPTDSVIPYIYAYQDEKAPLDERFHRMYSLEENDSTFFVIERFNSSFRIFEGYTFYLENNLMVQNHMMVDGNGIKRSSRLQKNTFFPLNKGEQVIFLANFPSHIDSTIIVYESRKTIIEDELEINVLGKDYKAINVRDSIQVSLVNLYNKKTASEFTVTNNYYAKGLGLVKWGDLEEEVCYELKKILTDNWWMEFAR